MNKSMIRYLLAKLLLIEAMLLCVPIVVALLNLKNDFVVKDSPTVFISLFCYHCHPPHPWRNWYLIQAQRFSHLRQRRRSHCGFVLDPLVLLWSPSFVFSGQIPNIIDAFFEISSGFTTTGATILNDVSVLSPSLLFWRSFTHLIGGMGVLVLP